MVRGGGSKRWVGGGLEGPRADLPPWVPPSRVGPTSDRRTVCTDSARPNSDGCHLEMRLVRKVETPLAADCCSKCFITSLWILGRSWLDEVEVATMERGWTCWYAVWMLCSMVCTSNPSARAAMHVGDAALPVPAAEEHDVVRGMSEPPCTYWPASYASDAGPGGDAQGC